MSRTATIALVGGLVVTAAVAAGLGVATVRGGEALQGVTVAGVDVGGLGREDLADALAPVVEQRRGASVEVVHEDDVFTVAGADVGIDVDVDRAVDEALAAGRPGLGLARLRSELTGRSDVTVSVPTTVDEQLVADEVERIAREVDTELVDGDVTVDPGTLEVDVAVPTDGRSTDVGATTDEVVAAFTDGDADEARVEAAVDVTPSALDPADVTTVGEQFRRAVAAPLTLRGNGEELVVEPRDVARMLVARRVGTDEAPSLELGVRQPVVREVLEERAEPLTEAPVEPSWDAPRQPPTTFDDKDDAVWRPVRDVGVTFRPGRNGNRFGIRASVAQLERLLAEGTREAPMRLPAVAPATSNEDARAYGVDDLLSTFTTYHACCQNRVANIQRLAEVVDGTLVQPGEQFSINGISGERACSKGYVEDGMILNGEIVASCGGGVSQFGTTTVNAVFFAGIDPDAYKPHSFYISRYPMAREATLNYPNLDVAWTNETGAPVLVRTTYTSTSITVSFYGNAEDLTEVRADVAPPSSYESFPTERRENPELPEGTTQVVQGGQAGFYVGLERTVVRPDGSSTDGWGFRYVPETEIIEFN